jgi:hypothetical protein
MMTEVQFLNRFQRQSNVSRNHRISHASSVVFPTPCPDLMRASYQIS